jgi:hypothetical protein
MDAKPEHSSLPELIDASQILAADPGPFRVLSPLERVASYLAAALFAVITAVLVAILIDWLLHEPPQPVITGLKPEEQKIAIDNFKLMSDTMWDRTSKIFDLMVIKALLPVFATVVGYLLGKRA